MDYLLKDLDEKTWNDFKYVGKTVYYMSAADVLRWFIRIMAKCEGDKGKIEEHIKTLGEVIK